MNRNQIGAAWTRNMIAALVGAAACFTLPPARADDAENAATSTRAWWNSVIDQRQALAGGAIAPKTATPPVINSITILTPDINVTTFPAPVRLRFDVTSSVGVNYVTLDIRSRDYHQGQRRELTLPAPRKTGTFAFESQLFENFNQPGAYDIRFVGVCDVLGQCSNLDYYSQPEDASRAMNVTNARGAPDIYTPQTSNATLLTKSLTTHSTGQALVTLTFPVTDTGTGVMGISTCARPAGEAYEVCGYWELPASTLNGTMPVTIPFIGNKHTTGTWHIAVVEITDRAGNNLFINDPATLDALFPGGRTFTLTNGT